MINTIVEILFWGIVIYWSILTLHLLYKILSTILKNAKKKQKENYFKDLDEAEQYCNLSLEYIDYYNEVELQLRKAKNLNQARSLIRSIKRPEMTDIDHITVFRLDCNNEIDRIKKLRNEYKS